MPSAGWIQGASSPTSVDCTSRRARTDAGRPDALSTRHFLPASFFPFTFMLITSQVFWLIAVFWQLPDLMYPPRQLTLQILGEPNLPKVPQGSVQIKQPNLTPLDVIFLPVGGRINFLLADLFGRFAPNLTPMPEPQYLLEIGPYIGQYGHRAPHNSNNQMESLDITFSLWEEPVEKPRLPIKNWWPGFLRCPPSLYFIYFCGIFL